MDLLISVRLSAYSLAASTAFTHRNFLLAILLLVQCNGFLFMHAALRPIKQSSFFLQVAMCFHYLVQKTSRSTSFLCLILTDPHVHELRHRCVFSAQVHGVAFSDQVVVIIGPLLCLSIASMTSLFVDTFLKNATNSGLPLSVLAGTLVAV